MGLNFRKRIKLGKFVNLNLGKGGAGISIGIPGARISLNSKGKSMASFGLPGTGLSYTKSLNSKSKKKILNQADSLSTDEAVVAYQESLFALTHIHNQAGDFIDFDTSPIEYETNEMGPHQKAAIAALENYQPSFFDKLLNKSSSKLKELQENIVTAIEKDNEEKEVKVVDAELENKLKQLDESAIRSFYQLANAFKVLEDDAQSYSYKLIKNVDVVTHVHIDLTINLDEDVFPNQISVLQSGKLSNKKLSKTDLLERQKAYLCSITLAFVTEALAYSPLDRCTINVFNTSINTASGFSETKCILAGEFDEKVLLDLDYEKLNPIEIVENSNVEYKLNSRTGFQEIKQI